jgi:hypothetical protein
MRQSDGRTGSLQAAYPKPSFPDQSLTEPGLEAVMNPRPCYQALACRPADKLAGEKRGV